MLRNVLCLAAGAVIGFGLSQNGIYIWQPKGLLIAVIAGIVFSIILHFIFE